MSSRNQVDGKSKRPVKKWQAVQIRRDVADMVQAEGVNLIPPTGVRGEAINAALINWLQLRGVKIEFKHEIGG